MERQPNRGPGNEECEEILREAAAERLKKQPRIWIACLAAYNDGKLHGEWITADREPEELFADIEAMLAHSPVPDAEEWAIFDYENFGDFRVHEFESIERVSKLALGVAEHGLAYSAWIELAGAEPGSWDNFDDQYQGHWDSLTAFAENLIEEFGIGRILHDNLPEQFQPYISFDVQLWGRDLELGGDVEVIDNPEGGVWIFWSRA